VLLLKEKVMGKKSKFNPNPSQPAPLTTCDESRRRALFVAHTRYEELSKKAVKAFFESAEEPSARLIPAALSEAVDVARERYNNLWCSHLKGWTTV
jgi:hypothetical protein